MKALKVIIPIVLAGIILAWAKNETTVSVVLLILVYFLVGLYVLLNTWKKEPEVDYNFLVPYEEGNPYMIFFRTMTQLLGPGQHYLFSIGEIKVVREGKKDYIRYTISGKLNHILRLINSSKKLYFPVSKDALFPPLKSTILN